jgi:leucyl/phenylalanyl-tRNA--protein transferase
MIPWLTENTPFPPLALALSEPCGLLAASHELTTAMLLNAYRQGIFPWFNPGDPVLWWSPNPRMILLPSEFKCSASLAKVLRNTYFEVRTDTVFEQIMRACAAPRGEQSGTWIDEQIINAYCALHQQGCAHSVEIWLNNELVGGLYGVAIGRMFYGESMFSRVSNASKAALAHLACQLDAWQFGMIDCQMYTPHLASLGAKLIPRNEFISRLKELINYPPVDNWQFDSDCFRKLKTENPKLASEP